MSLFGLSNSAFSFGYSSLSADKKGKRKRRCSNDYCMLDDHDSRREHGLAWLWHQNRRKIDRSIARRRSTQFDSAITNMAKAGATRKEKAEICFGGHTSTVIPRKTSSETSRCRDDAAGEPFGGEGERRPPASRSAAGPADSSLRTSS